nr:MAG: hypothetical protein DIU73_03210 [Actinomycetota bacterium]
MVCLLTDRSAGVAHAGVDLSGSMVHQEGSARTDHEADGDVAFATRAVERVRGLEGAGRPGAGPTAA